MTKMGPSVIPYSSSATGAARERLADERRLRIFPEDERMKNLRTRLSEKQAQGATFGGKEGLGVEILRFLAQTKVDPQFAPLVNDFTKRVSDLIRSSNEQQRKTQNQIPSSFNPRAQPIPSASLDPRATERFSTSATQLASALTGDNTNITQLSSAVNSLTPVTNDLKNAVNQLSALFKDGKIQVAQETKGEVNVNFNNSLPIERDANADTRFLEQISTMAQNTISEQLRSFIRQYS
jgi:hypothetical protein